MSLYNSPSHFGTPKHSSRSYIYPNRISHVLKRRSAAAFLYNLIYRLTICRDATADKHIGL